MVSSSVLTAVFMAVFLLSPSYAWRVRLYRDKDFLGGHIDMLSDECANVPGDFNDQTSSVDTHGGCVRLYQHAGCAGRVVEAFPGSGAHHQLSQHDFNDRTSSVGPCWRGKRSAPAYQSDAVDGSVRNPMEILNVIKKIQEAARKAG